MIVPASGPLWSNGRGENFFLCRSLIRRGGAPSGAAASILKLITSHVMPAAEFNIQGAIAISHLLSFSVTGKEKIPEACIQSDLSITCYGT